MDTEKRDIFERVTQQIISAIEAGAGSYRMPWNTAGGIISSPINATSRKPYRGINVLILWATAQEKGFTSGTWATYKQWQELGAQVKKGERSAHVVFWKFFDVDGEGDSAESAHTSRRIPMARDYFVFNADQVDGYKAPEEKEPTHAERIEYAEKFFASLQIDLRPGGNRAYYNGASDTVHMPDFNQFKSPTGYYSVLSHETTHWSGAKHRLNRDMTGRFGTAAYAMEELAAELGAAFLCGELAIPSDPRTDHAPYVASWLSTLRNDKRAIFTAAGKAQEAVDWMAKRAKEPEKAA